MLEYDPYLDTKLIPPARDDKDLKKLSEEERKKIEEEDKKVRDALEKLKSDPMANTIFARQDYVLKDGISIGFEREKYYLFLHADDDFMERADRKLKESIKSIKRADQETEKKVIEYIDSERQGGEQGIGAIFG
jgi:hypothetical protein